MDKDSKLEADMVVMTAGFTPQTKDIGLDKVGVQLDDKGYVRINENSMTSVDKIYAIGDVCNRGPRLAHKSVDQALTLIDYIMNKNPIPVNFDTIPQAIYTFPEVASVGLTEQKAEQMKRPYVTGCFDFKNNERANSSGLTEGFVKVLVCAEKQQILGVHIIGPDAISLIS